MRSAVRAWLLGLGLGLGVLLAAGCEREHAVRIQLGPTPDGLTIGFLCRDASGALIADNPRTRTPGGGVRFQVVVDLVDLGGQVPGCRGEELLAACGDGACTLAPTPRRFCTSVEIARDELATAGRDALIERLRAALASEPVTRDAPEAPVVIRVATTSESCDSVQDGTLALDQVVGCAYSCPVQLDEVDGPIAVSLDTLDDRCVDEMRVCAAFPFAD